MVGADSDRSGDSDSGSHIWAPGGRGWPSFGVLATVLQLAAVRVVKPVIEGPAKELIKRWGIGMGLRFLGVVLFLVAVLWSRDIFPPLPTAIAYLGVLVPLLFTELRLIK